MLAAARTLRVALGHLFAVGHLHFVSVHSARFASCSKFANALPSAMLVSTAPFFSKLANARAAFTAFSFSAFAVGYAS